MGKTYTAVELQNSVNARLGLVHDMQKAFDVLTMNREIAMQNEMSGEEDSFDSNVMPKNKTLRLRSRNSARKNNWFNKVLVLIAVKNKKYFVESDKKLDHLERIQRAKGSR